MSFGFLSPMNMSLSTLMSLVEPRMRCSSPLRKPSITETTMMRTATLKVTVSASLSVAVSVPNNNNDLHIKMVFDNWAFGEIVGSPRSL